MTLSISAMMSDTMFATRARANVPAGNAIADSDAAVYDEIEALIARDLPRRGCVELAQVLEDVIALLAPPASEFSDPHFGVRLMGADTAHR